VLPPLLEQLPGGFFDGCWRLASVGLSQCSRLRVLGSNVFMPIILVSSFVDCLSMERLEIPPSVEMMNLSGSGLRCLDLRGVRAAQASVADCQYLERVVAPRSCDLGRSLSSAMLRTAEMGAGSGFAATDALDWGAEVRYREAVWTAWRSLIYLPDCAPAEPVGFVLAEMAGLARREGRPFLPC
jgi:hypothetical protein